MKHKFDKAVLNARTQSVSLRESEQARDDLADKVTRLVSALAKVTEERDRFREENRELSRALRLARADKAEATQVA